MHLILEVILYISNFTKFFNYYVINFFSNADVHYLNSTKDTGPEKISHSDVIGIGNGGLDHPYKKVEVGKEEFKYIVQDVDISKQDDLIEKLIQFLKSKEKYAKFINFISKIKKVLILKLHILIRLYLVNVKCTIRNIIL